MSDIEYEKKLKKFIIPVLRRASYRWPERNECLKLSRVERGIYKCAHCSDNFPRKEVQVDHIEPVVPLDLGAEKQTLDSYIRRMFCNINSYQVLCESCHSVKTAYEVQTRKQNRQSLRKKIVKRMK